MTAAGGQVGDKEERADEDVGFSPWGCWRSGQDRGRRRYAVVKVEEDDRLRAPHGLKEILSFPAASLLPSTDACRRRCTTLRNISRTWRHCWQWTQ